MMTPGVFSRKFAGRLVPALLVAGWMLAAPHGWSQSTQPDSPTGGESTVGGQAENADGKISREQVLAIMSREVVLAPGIGLRNIRLGEPMEQVKNRLGPPAQVDRSGILSNIITLTYLLDAGTVVAVSGRDFVEKITVRGNSAGLVRTAQGARFGMEPRLILRIYREPSRSRGNRLEYAHRGITFEFKEGGVALMDLYPRKR